MFTGADDGASGEVLYLQKHRVLPGEHRVIVTVPRQPARAVINVGGDNNVREMSR